MNDADWLRKHLRGKTQRARAETSDSRVRRAVGRLLQRLGPPKSSEPSEPPKSEGPGQDD